MIDLKQIQAYYPPLIQNQPGFRKYMLKEYVLLMILDYLSTTVYVKKLVFIGGTCIRFTKGINRFSKDLDFDCKDFSESEFNLTNS